MTQAEVNAWHARWRALNTPAGPGAGVGPMNIAFVLNPQIDVVRASDFRARAIQVSSTQGGADTHDISVRLLRLPNRPMDEVLEFICLKLKLSIVDLLPGRDISPIGHWGAIDLVQNKNIKSPANGRNSYFAWANVSPANLRVTLASLTSRESEEVSVLNIEWTCRVRSTLGVDVYQALGGDIDLWEGFGKRKRQIVTKGDSFCGCQSLVVGLDWLAGHHNLARAEGPHARRRLTKARELHAQLGLDPEGGMTVGDFKTFVEHRTYCTYRVKVIPSSGGVILDRQIKTYTGSQFFTPPGASPDYVGETIYVLYDMDNAHFTPITHKNIKSDLRVSHSINDKDNGRTRFCNHCNQLFFISTPKRQREWALHNCRGLRACEACGKYYPNELKHLANAKPCPNKCGALIGSESCFKEHMWICSKRMVCEDCGRSHRSDRCGKRLCPGCFKQIDAAELVSTHRDCWSKKKLKKGKEAEDDVESLLSGISEESESETDLNNVWAADMETMPQKVERVFAPMRWRREFFYDEEINYQDPAGAEYFLKGELIEQVPHLVQIRNFATNEVITWSSEDYDDPVLQFITFFLAKEERQTIYFHNASSFDGQLAYNCIVNNIGEICIKNIKTGGMIMEGCKIKKLTFGNAVILDSLLHLKSSLDGLPSMLEFDLDAFEEKYGFKPKKTHFPYTFATRENLDYTGTLPPIEFYGIARLVGEDKKKLEQWHAEESARVGDQWNLRKTYLEYLNIDTAILAEAMIRYRQLCLDTGMLDPIGVVTLPALCLKSFKELYMEENTIPILRSFPEATHLKYSAATEYQFCKEAYKGGNTTNWYLAFALDALMITLGWIIKMMDFVSMYPSVMVNHAYPVGDYEWNDYADGQPRLEDIWNKEGVICAELGPTRAIHHPPLWKVINGKLCFPLIKARGPNSMAHIHKHCWNFKDPKGCGNMECKICPAYISGKIDPPQHYTMPEFRAAIEEYGYECTWIFGTLLTSESRTDIYNEYYGQAYGNKTRHSKPPKFNWSDPAVCKDYVKQLWERSCIRVPEEFHSHPQDWHQPNGALKQMGKLQSNSFYGKLGPDVYKEQSVLVSGLEDEEALLRGEKGELAGQVIQHGGAMLGRLKSKFAQRNIKECNMMHAAYVTAYARLKLARVMNDISNRGGNVLYCDTDSILAAFPPGCALPPIGPYLGDLDDETEGKGVIDRYVGLLPKSYAMMNTDDKLVKMRFKGVSGVTEGRGGDKRNMDLLGWEQMVHIADMMLAGKGFGYPVHHRITRWNRNSLSPSITWQESWKLARADVNMLKGKLASSCRIYPLGAENFNWGEDIEWVDASG